MTKARSSNNKSAQNEAATRKRPRAPVQVVACGAAFPISSKPRCQPNPEDDDKKSVKSSNSNLLDFHDMAHEIRHYGSAALDKRSRKDYEAEEYQRLTGRRPKHHAVPLPIVRGIRKKKAARERRLEQQAKEAGVVLPTPKKKKKTVYQKKRELHGPAPSIGFLSKGVLRLKDKPT